MLLEHKDTARQEVVGEQVNLVNNVPYHDEPSKEVFQHHASFPRGQAHACPLPEALPMRDPVVALS